VDMSWLVAVGRVEEESIRALTMNGRHKMSVPLYLFRCGNCLANYLWSRPTTPLASLRDSPMDVLRTYVLVGADLNTYAAASIRNVIGRQGSRPTAVGDIKACRWDCARRADHD
jgi:hypothetical protein